MIDDLFSFIWALDLRGFSRVTPSTLAAFLINAFLAQPFSLYEHMMISHDELLSKEFQSFGGTMKKAPSPLVFLFVLGTNNNNWSKVSANMKEYSTSKGRIDLWARLWGHFNANKRILKSIQKWIGSQWRDAYTRVICYPLWAPVKSWAATFWTFCSRGSNLWLSPTWSALQ